MLTIITPFTGVYFISILISSTVRPFPYPSRPSLFRERAGTHSFTGSNRIINLFYPIMKESIFSFFNAPITNQVSNGVVCVSQLHAYITTSEWLHERTDQVRAASGDEKRFRRLKQSLLPYVTPPVSSPTAGKITCYCRGRVRHRHRSPFLTRRGDPLEGHAVRRRAATPRSLLRESQYHGNQAPRTLSPVDQENRGGVFRRGGTIRLGIS